MNYDFSPRGSFLTALTRNTLDKKDRSEEEKFLNIQSHTFGLHLI